MALVDPGTSINLKTGKPNPTYKPGTQLKLSQNANGSIQAKKMGVIDKMAKAFGAK